MVDTATTDTGYSTGNVVEQSQYQDVMQYPMLQENAVDDASTNGLAMLSDYKSCKVTWLANQIPTLQLIYPRNGKFVKLLKTQRIVVGDVNRILTHQKFRIIEVLHDQDQITVNANHIIGEYLIHNPVKGTNLPKLNSISQANATASWTLGMILNNLVYQVPELNFESDVQDVRNVNIDVSNADALNLILDPDQQGDQPANSVLAQFGGQFIFDGTTIYHRKKAGVDRNIWVRYGSDITTYSQDKSINDTYVAIYPFATYNPGQAQATESNVDWNALITKTNWTSIGSVTYNAGGSIDVYDSPVKGQQAIRKINVGDQIKLGPALNDGTMLTSLTGTQVQVSTVNGDAWYPIAPEDGGGWIESTWVNFSKNGDYIVNDATGHVTIDAKSGQSLTRYPVSGYATVTYSKSPGLIHVYYAPDQGPDHYRTGETYKNGERVHYDYYALDENGKPWYRIGPHKWLYGEHLSVNKEHDVQTYPSRGLGYVKKTAKKYEINKKKGTVQVAKHHLSLTEARKQHKQKGQYVWRGKGKNRHKVWIPNPDYQVGKPITHKAGYYRLDYGQVVIAGVTYYKLSNGSYVKASDIDKKARKTELPTQPSKIISQNADQQGKVEMYSAPSKGAAINWSIPDGQSFDIDHTAEGADGKTWYEVTYEGHTGWIPADSTSTSAATDMEPTTSDNDNPYGEDDTKNVKVDEQSVMVELDDSFDNVLNGALFADGMQTIESPHIMRLDLSAHIHHDDQDQSGLQPDGTWVATADDKQQLYQAAVSALKEYDIGVFPITMNVEYAKLRGDRKDLLALNMYDTVNVDFTQFDTVQKGQVTGTVWNMAGEESSYDSVTIGEPPKTLAHTLLDQAKQDTSNAITASEGRTHGLLSEYSQLLQQEGSSRLAHERKMMKDLGLVQETTDKNGKAIENQLVTMKEFEERMNSIDATATDIKNWTLSSGSGVIQAYPSWQAPTELTAYNSNTGTKMAFTGNGLIFYNSDGTQKLRSGLDSNGQIYADSIKSGTIEAVSIKACTINSSLAFQDPTSSMSIYIGTDQPAQVSLTPYYGGRVIWLWSNNYQSMVSSGQVAVSSGGATTRVQPSLISVGNDSNHVLTQGNFADHAYSTIKTWVQGWVADYITVNGKQHTIWKGKDYDHASEMLP